MCALNVDTRKHFRMCISRALQAPIDQELLTFHLCVNKYLNFNRRMHTCATRVAHIQYRKLYYLYKAAE